LWHAMHVQGLVFFNFKLLASNFNYCEHVTKILGPQKYED